MATFVPISYTYVPTAPRSKSATARRKPAPKQSSILDKLKHIKPSSTSLRTARPAAAARRADDMRGGKLGTRETDTVNDSDDDENDDDCDLPSIEQLLYTRLQKEGFSAEDQRSNNTTFGVGDATAEERSGSHDDDNGSAPGDNSGGSPDDPIVLLGDDDSSASEAEVDDGGRAESAGADAGLFDNPENAADSTTLAPPSPNVWHDIDDFPKTSQPLRPAQQGASSDSTHAPLSVPLSRLSSEPLHDSIGAVDLDPRRARSEATTSCSACPQNPPPRRATVSSGNQLSHEGRLHTSRGVADERGLVGPARNADPVDKREQQEMEQEEDEEDNDEDTSSKSEHPPSLQGASAGKCRPLCENSVILGREAIEPPQADVDLLDWEADSMAPIQLKVWPKASADRDTKALVDNQLEGLVKGVAAEPTAKRVGDTHLFGKVDGSPRRAERQQLLPNREPSPAASHDEAGCDGHRGDELNNTESDKDDEERRPMKRKLPASSQDGLMHKKPKPRLQQRSTGQHRPRSKPHKRSPKSHSQLDQGSRVAAVPSPQARPCTPHAADTGMSPDCYNLDRLSGAALPMLTEVTFRPHSLHCCSFTAVIRDGCAERGVSFSQVVRLIASTGHVGKIDDFTIKPVEQHSFLLTGFSRHTSPRPSFGGTTLSTATKAGRDHVDPTRTRPQEGRAVDAGALASRRSKPSISDDDGDLSDSDPDVSSDDDGCSSEAEKQGGSSARMNIPWDPVDEQRLVAWKKEGKPWNWILKKLPGRTESAVRQRVSIVKNRGK